MVNNGSHPRFCEENNHQKQKFFMNNGKAKHWLFNGTNISHKAVGSLHLRIMSYLDVNVCAIEFSYQFYYLYVLPLDAKSIFTYNWQPLKRVVFTGIKGLYSIERKINE